MDSELSVSLSDRHGPWRTEFMTPVGACVCGSVRLTSRRYVDVEIETFLVLFVQKRQQPLDVVDSLGRHVALQSVDVGHTLRTDGAEVEGHTHAVPLRTPSHFSMELVGGMKRSSPPSSDAYWSPKNASTMTVLERG